MKLETGIKDAALSECRKYRYSLSRIWDTSKPYALFMGLNPSTADEINNDNTISTEIRYSKSWGYGGLLKGNLFALRAREPEDMKKAVEPIGVDNDRYIIDLAKKAEIIILAWGNNGAYLNRSKNVIKMLPPGKLYYLKINKTGEPHHSLYLSADLKPIKYLR